jgi:hypothetical protein
MVKATKLFILLVSSVLIIIVAPLVVTLSWALDNREKESWLHIFKEMWRVTVTDTYKEIVG